MKKIMSLMLGMSLVLGTVTLLSADDAKTTTTKTTKAAKPKSTKAPKTAKPKATSTDAKKTTS